MKVGSSGKIIGENKKHKDFIRCLRTPSGILPFRFGFGNPVPVSLLKFTMYDIEYLKPPGEGILNIRLLI